MGLPRMRGDRPHRLVGRARKEEFTPHARGSTQTTLLRPMFHYVYPACAGIDRIFPVHPACNRSLPRMRGDRPQKPLLTVFAM